MSAAPFGVLACPRCEHGLARAPAMYHCTACRIDFPDFAGLPWLFSEPHASRHEWRQRFQLLLRRLEHEAAQLEQALGRPDLLPGTRERLAHLEAAKREHARRLTEILAPLLGDQTAARYETYLALRTRLPPEQGITTYYANAHRDWCWGDEENLAAQQLLSAALAEADPTGVMVVLGAGAGRLAYDLHQNGSAALTLALDLNPFLMLLADRMSRGESVELHEFPLAPRSLAECAPLRRLAAPAPARPGLQCIIADALHAPVLPGSIDTIVTPWLVDIVAEDFARFAARINRWLRPGGRWIHFGSLSFHHADPTLRYSLEECLEIVVAAGFGTPDCREEVLPYLCSPASRHARREEVLLWSAPKEREARRLPKAQAMPEWLVRGELPVPALAAFQSQALTTRIHAFLMAQIDGRRSLREIAQALVAQGLMSAQEAEPALRGFLTKMLDDSERPVAY
jgi:SAM-dependent methyltransferase